MGLGHDNARVHVLIGLVRRGEAEAGEREE